MGPAPGSWPARKPLGLAGRWLLARPRRADGLAQSSRASTEPPVFRCDEAAPAELAPRLGWNDFSACDSASRQAGAGAAAAGLKLSPGRLEHLTILFRPLCLVLFCFVLLCAVSYFALSLCFGPSRARQPDDRRGPRGPPPADPFQLAAGGGQCSGMAGKRTASIGRPLERVRQAALT